MGWGSLRVSKPAEDFLPQGLIVRYYNKEIAELVSDEIHAHDLFMEACSKICHLFDRLQSLPGGKVQLFTQVTHLIEIIKQYRKDARKWTRADKIHSVREALELENTNLTDARKVAKIITLLLAEGNFNT